MTFDLFNLEFYSPWFFLLFAAFIPLIFLDLRKKKRTGIRVPTIRNMQENRGILFVLFLLKISKYIILSALIIAMARPEPLQFLRTTMTVRESTLCFLWTFPSVCWLKI